MRKPPQSKRYSITPPPHSVVVTCHASGTQIYPYVVSSLLSPRRTLHNRDILGKDVSPAACS